MNLNFFFVLNIALWGFCSFYVCTAQQQFVVLNRDELPALAGPNFATTLSLNFSSQNIYYIDSLTFSGLTNLNDLFLSYNKISSIASRTFSDLVNLKRLDLGGNALTSIHAATFANLKMLQSLSIWGSQLVSLEAAMFASLVNLGFI